MDAIFAKYDQSCQSLKGFQQGSDSTQMAILEDDPDYY